MIRLLENRGVKEEKEKAEVLDEDLLAYLEEQYRRQDQIGVQLGNLEKEATLYEPWGKFSKERIAGLTEAGWDLRFFTVPDRKYLPEWEDQFHATIINEQRGQKYFVTITPAGESEKPDADVFIFPQESEESIRGNIKQLREEQLQLVAHLDNIAVNSLKRLKHYRETISEVTDFLQVENASQGLVEEKVIALEGWIPVTQEADMKEFLQSREVYYDSLFRLLMRMCLYCWKIIALLNFLNLLPRCLRCLIIMNWTRRHFSLHFSCCFLGCVWEMEDMDC